MLLICARAIVIIVIIAALIGDPFRLGESVHHRLATLILAKAAAVSLATAPVE